MRHPGASLGGMGNFFMLLSPPPPGGGGFGADKQDTVFMFLSGVGHYIFPLPSSPRFPP